MAFDGNGNYTPPAPPVFPAVSGTTIRADYFNTVVNDIGGALSKTITRDGQSPPTANLPMGGFKLTGLSVGTARTDSARVGDVQDGKITTLTAVSGSNTIAATSSPLITAYTSGMNFRFIAAAANTAAVTININGLGAVALTKSGAQPLEAGDIAAGAAIQVHYDGTNFQLVSGAGGGAKAGGTIYENGNNVTSSYTISTGKNAMSAGPITVADGVTVTVPDGSTWTVV